MALALLALEDSNATAGPVRPWGMEDGAGDQAVQRKRLVDAFRAIIDRLDAQAQRQVEMRAPDEQRWLEDERHYHGLYAPDEYQVFRAAGRSTAFLKLARKKTHAWRARLTDMLFPTDDRNWGIRPTPRPELAQEASQAVAYARRAAEAANEAAAAGNAAAERAALTWGEAAAERARQAQGEIDEARRRCEAMEELIHDQLVECRYNAKARDQIAVACRLGTGVKKGPVVAAPSSSGWVHEQDGWQLGQNQAVRPEFVGVDVWNFFPDMSAARIEDAEFTYERHLMTSTQLRKLARREGFDKDVIRALLTEGPQDTLPDYVGQLRSMSGNNRGAPEARFTVWEYHGPLSSEDIQTVADYLSDGELKTMATPDPLDEVRVVMFFCQGQLLSINPHPLDSGEHLYDLFCFEQNPGSIFGFGVPHLMKDSQRSLNAAWRMMIDNGSISAAPQVVVDRNQIEPADGDWTLKPFKIWNKTVSGVPASSAPFEVFQINNNQAQVANLIGLAREFADEETNMPPLAMGESAAHVTTTANGMAMLMNSANVVFRDIVKSFDDDATEPPIRRLYHWNMQFHPDEGVKGDMEVDARGSSVLLVKELQAQNLMSLAQFVNAPAFAGMFREGALPVLRKITQSMMLSSEEIVKSKDEYERWLAEQVEAAQAAAEQGAGQGNGALEQIRLKIAQIEAESRERVAQLNYEAQMMSLAEKRNIELDRLAAMLQARKIDTDSGERRLAVEVAIEERNARRAAAAGREPGGSGGFISAG